MLRNVTRSFAVRAKKSAGTVKLTPEEEAHMRTISTRILSDKYCEVSEKESELYLYPKVSLFAPARFLPSVTDTLSWMLFRRHTSTSRFSELTEDRIRNTELQEMFGLTPTNFNHRVYWLTIHSWMLHQRFLVEKLNKLESDYVDRIWLMPYKWMMEKGVPRHRLQVELEHSHRYSLKLSVELDQAISRPDILPGQICEVVWRTIFSEDPRIKSANDPKVLLLTKYILRNLNFVLNSVPKDHFIQGAFAWPARTSEFSLKEIFD